MRTTWVHLYIAITLILAPLPMVARATPSSTLMVVTPLPRVAIPRVHTARLSGSASLATPTTTPVNVSYGAVIDSSFATSMALQGLWFVSATPTPTATVMASYTATSTPIATYTGSPTPTAVVIQYGSHIDTSLATAVAAAGLRYMTETPTASPTSTPTAIVVAYGSNSDAIVQTQAAIQGIRVESETPTATFTATNTATMTATVTPTPTVSDTATATNTRTATVTPTLTP
ncbi:MAG: hypothetical protein ACK45X_12985, partial [Roseiflexaceae bacterium]